uniref:Uncharacterized protein n=1 Tax=Cucumis melo TaxID=3656 RepID=A0A9I9E943_CUCME
MGTISKGPMLLEAQASPFPNGPNRLFTFMGRSVKSRKRWSLSGPKQVEAQEMKEPPCFFFFSVSAEEFGEREN